MATSLQPSDSKHQAAQGGLLHRHKDHRQRYPHLLYVFISLLSPGQRLYQADRRPRPTILPSYPFSHPPSIDALRRPTPVQ